MSVILNLVTKKDAIDFASNYNPTTSNVLDQLMPNEKTPNLVVAYKTAKKNQFAEMAEVHAYNTEDKIILQLLNLNVSFQIEVFKTIKKMNFSISIRKIR